MSVLLDSLQFIHPLAPSRSGFSPILDPLASLVAVVVARSHTLSSQDLFQPPRCLYAHILPLLASGPCFENVRSGSPEQTTRPNFAMERSQESSSARLLRRPANSRGNQLSQAACIGRCHFRENSRSRLRLTYPIVDTFMSTHPSPTGAFPPG